ncbi:MAG TPA: hypothetical protein VF950_00245 [Planctomycetota bacterium]
MKRAEERVDRASIFLSGPGERDILGALGTARMRFRCRPGFIRNLAEPILTARLERRPDGGTNVFVDIGMRKVALGFMTLWLGAAGLAALGFLATARPMGLAVALVGAALFTGCVLAARPERERLLRLSDEIFGGG